MNIFVQHLTKKLKRKFSIFHLETQQNLGLSKTAVQHWIQCWSVKLDHHVPWPTKEVHLLLPKSLHCLVDSKSHRQFHHWLLEIQSTQVCWYIHHPPACLPSWKQDITLRTLRTKAAFTRNIQITINTNPILQHEFFNQSLVKATSSTLSYLVGGQLPPSWKNVLVKLDHETPMFMVTIFGIMCFSTKCWKSQNKSN